jgi:hypothetical protein
VEDGEAAVAASGTSRICFCEAGGGEAELIVVWVEPGAEEEHGEEECGAEGGDFECAAGGYHSSCGSRLDRGRDVEKIAAPVPCRWPWWQE